MHHTSLPHIARIEDNRALLGSLKSRYLIGEKERKKERKKLRERERDRQTDKQKKRERQMDRDRARDRN